MTNATPVVYSTVKPDQISPSRNISKHHPKNQTSNFSISSSQNVSTSNITNITEGTDRYNNTKQQSHDHHHLPETAALISARNGYQEQSDSLEIGDIKNQIIGDLNQNLRKWYNSASDKVKTAFASQDISKLNFQDLMDIPAGLWKKINDSVIATTTKEQLKFILSQLKSYGDTTTAVRFLDAAKDRFTLKEYMDEGNQLVGRNVAKAKAFLRPLIEKLGSPREWNESVIDILGPSAFFIPNEHLVQMDKKQAIRKMLVFYEKEVYANPRETMANLNDKVKLVPSDLRGPLRDFIIKVEGPLSEWKFATIRKNSRYLPLFHPSELATLDDFEVLQAKDVLGVVDFKDRAHAQPILQKIFIRMDFSRMKNEREFTTFLTSLNNLEKFVTLLELEYPLQEFLRHSNSRILDYLKRHLAITNDEMLGQFLYGMNGPDTWQTALQVQGAGKLLQFAGPDRVRALADRNLLNKASLEQIGSVPRLEKGLVLLLRRNLRDYFVVGNSFHLGSLPAGFVPAIANDEIAALPESDVQRHIEKFNQQAIGLNPAQRIQLVNKIKQREFAVKNLHPNFASMIPPHQLNKLTNEHVEALLEEMAPASPQLQFYIQKKYGSTDLTLEDLRESPRLIGAMSTTMIDTLDPNDIFEILVIVNESPISPRPKVVKHLAYILKQYLRNYTSSSSMDDTNLLSALKDSEIELVGGQVLTEFSVSAFKSIAKNRCKQIFASIGRLSPLHFMNVQPPNKRRHIADAALSCLDKKNGEALTIADVQTLGFLLNYVSESVLSTMEPSVFLFALPHLQGIINEADERHIHQILPCFSGEMKKALRSKILDVFGKPINWSESTLWTVGCLLTTMETDDLDSMDPALLFRIKHAIGNCSWQEAKHQSVAFQVYIEQCMLLLDGDQMDMGTYQLERKLTEAATIGADRYSALAISNRRKKRTGRNEPISCDAIRMTGGSLKLTPEELKGLNIKNLEACLDILGDKELDEKEATILWNEIKDEYGGPSYIPSEVILQMGRITKALNPDEIGELPLKNLDVIASVGTVDEFTHEQLKALSKQAIDGIRTDDGNRKHFSMYSSEDLVSLGHILCGFDSKHIEEVPVSSYSEASAALGYLEPCNEETLRALAEKAMHHRAYGDPSKWTSDIVSTVGVVIGGLAPEQLWTISNSSFEGLTREGARSLTSGSLRTLSTGQLKSFSVEAALALRSDQRAELSTDQSDALTSVYITPGDGSIFITSNSFMIISLLIFPILLYHYHSHG